MIRSIRGWPLLDGYRGRPKADVETLAKAIVAISKLAHRNADRIKTIEVNPLLVLDEGEGVVPLDAVIETNGTETLTMVSYSPIVGRFPA